MQLPINEHTAVISRCKINIPEALDYSNYELKTRVDVTSIEHKDNNDGTVDVLYKIKSCGVAEFTDQMSKKTRGIKKGSQSQKTRFSVAIYHEEHLGEENYEFIHHDLDEFYSQFQQKLRGNLDNVIRLLFTK